IPKGAGQSETPHPTSSLGHPLPSEREKIIARTGAENRAFPLRGERVDRAARFHQRARDG
ncbi:MAG: hypothetical protein P4N24_21600, partial [Acidobacteriota bacterium]|nr:hypothetical protein [Acidobacteriota bacterium]